VTTATLDLPQSVSLFAGYGGLDIAVTNVFGSELIAYSEIEPNACLVMGKHYRSAPNLGDVTKIDWSKLDRDERRSLILTGGFPCQDVSTAGFRKGLRPGTRSGLWSHMAYAIGELRPELVVIENVRGLTSADAHSDLELCPWCLGIGGGHHLRALGAVLGSLADLGYDAQWYGLPASDAGAPHPRFRVFILAWPATAVAGRRDSGATADANVLAARRATGERPSERRDARRESAPIADPAGIGGDRAGRGAQRLALGGVAAPDTDNGGSRLGRGRDGSREAARAGRDNERGPGARDLANLDTVAQALDRGISRWTDVEWGIYEPAIRRWETITGRAVPSARQYRLGGGGLHLAERLVEWMQGLPDGHVTGVRGITRGAMLRMLGNGVVPQQAEMAIRIMLERRERFGSDMPVMAPETAVH